MKPKKLQVTTSLTGGIALTKDNIREAAVKEAQRLLSAQGDLIAVAVRSKAIAEYLTTLVGTIKPELLVAIRDAKNMHPEGIIEVDGAQVTISRSGAKYDYSQDDEWSRLNRAHETAKSRLSNREKYLKSIEPDVSGYDEQGQPIYNGAAPATITKEGTEFPLITLQK